MSDLSPRKKSTQNEVDLALNLVEQLEAGIKPYTDFFHEVNKALGNPEKTDSGFERVDAFLEDLADATGTAIVEVRTAYNMGGYFAVPEA